MVSPIVSSIVVHLAVLQAACGSHFQNSATSGSLGSTTSRLRLPFPKQCTQWFTWYSVHQMIKLKKQPNSEPVPLFVLLCFLRFDLCCFLLRELVELMEKVTQPLQFLGVMEVSSLSYVHL